MPSIFDCVVFPLFLLIVASVTEPKKAKLSTIAFSSRELFTLFSGVTRSPFPFPCLINRQDMF